MAKQRNLGEILSEDEQRDQQASPTSAGTKPSRTGKSKAASGGEPPARGRRTKPVRLTIDVDPELHRKLRYWALTEADDARLSDVLRALIGSLEDTAVSTAVLTELRRREG